MSLLLIYEVFVECLVCAKHFARDTVDNRNFNSQSLSLGARRSKERDPYSSLYKSVFEVCSRFCDILEENSPIQIGADKFLGKLFGGGVISELRKPYERWHFQELDFVESEA